MSLLLALSAFFSKTIAYFNSNVISLNGNFQSIVYMVVFLLLLEFVIIFLFLLLKGYLIAIQDDVKDGLNTVVHALFKNIFIFPIGWFISSSSAFLLYGIFNRIFADKSQKIYFVVSVVLMFFLIVMTIRIVIYLNAKGNKDGIVIDGKSNRIVVFSIILLIFLLYTELYLLPTHLLIGSFSINAFPQSDTIDGTSMFEITEMGMPYSKNHVKLYHMGTPDTPLFDMVDSIVLRDDMRTVSEKRFMWGIKHEGVYYINIYNKSDLSSGNYVLHAEVTDDSSKKSTFGVSQKHADKIFFIE